MGISATHTAMEFSDHSICSVNRIFRIYAYLEEVFCHCH